MIHTKVLLIGKSEHALIVQEVSTGKDFTIPVACLKGLQFYPNCVDETDQLPKVGKEYPAVMKDDGTMYLDRYDQEYWTYSALSSDVAENNWLQIVRRLLELSQIGSLTPQLTQEMLRLYHSKQYALLEEKLIKECRLFEYVWAEESQLIEHKSSLVYSAGFKQGEVLTQERRMEQLDELSQALVGAANAKKKEDYHLVIGVTDHQLLTTHLSDEVDQFFGGNINKFIDVFTNRLNQIVENPMFTSSLRFEPFTTQGRLILDVVVPYWDGDVLFYRKQVYLRIQKTTTKLEGAALVNYIRSLNH